MLKAAGRRRRPRVLGVVAGGLVVLLAVGSLAVAWYFAGVAVAVSHAVDRPLSASPAGANAVRLTGPDLKEAKLPGTYGLDFPGGYGVLGPVESTSADAVVRAFTARQGALPAGTTARVDTYAYDGDPHSALGLDDQDVKVHDALGDFPAWYVPAQGPTWFVFVHGHDGARGESLRYLTALHRAGMPVLVPTYRNDVGAPASPDGVDHLGLTEWQDVDAAVHWALDHGAHDVVLGGWSMGGAVVLQTADRSDVRDRIRGLVLDSPVVDWSDVLHHQADLRGLPGPETALALWTAERRFGLDFGRLDWVARAAELRVPTLLLHSDADDYVPDGPGKALAARRPDLVTLDLIPGAGHTQGWNTDPAGYEQRLLSWLTLRGATAR